MALKLFENLASGIGRIIESVIVINVVLKFAGLVTWSWWFVFWPLGVSLSLVVILFFWYLANGDVK